MKQANANEKSILVVKDESGIAKVYTMTPSAEEFQVEVAPDGKAVLDLSNEKELKAIAKNVLAGKEREYA